MATTYYVPNTTGWATSPSGGYVRIKVVQTYNNSTNKSSLVISLQGKRTVDPAAIWDFFGYNISVGGTVICDNSTHYPGRLAANVQSTNTWYDIRSWGATYEDQGAIKTWTHTVSHSTNGSANVSFAFSGQFTCSGSGGEISPKTATLDISQTRTFTLSISAGAGSSITVKKGSTSLTNGATIAYGDVLTITFIASTGYNISTHKVNNSTFTSGNSHTVTGDVSVTSTATLKTFTLSISAGAGSSITVKKGSTSLTNGATIAYGDVLTITFIASTGYNISTHKVNNSTFTSGNSHTVTGDVSVTSTATLKTFTLSISAGAGSSITVKKGSTTLSNGATITYGDVLTITFAASTGYNLSTHKVNDSNFTSGSTHTVTKAVSVTSTATVKSFTLSVSAGTGSSITVNRTSSPLGGGSTGNLSNGTTIYYNDVLNVSYSASTGCTINTHTINGSQFTSGSNYTVTAAVSVITTATVNSYRLTVSAGANTTVTVNRTSSPLGKATTGYIQNGATIYYNDVLNITWTASDGYSITTRTVNGVTKTSGQSYTVTSAISVVVAATVNSYSISSTIADHTELLITRTASPEAGAQIGLVTDSIVYYGDVISIQAIPSSGYGIDSLKVNSIEVTNPKSMTVTSNITIVVLIKALGFIYIDSGSSIEKYKIIIDSGSTMEQYRAMIDTGSAIVPY